MTHVWLVAGLAAMVVEILLPSFGFLLVGVAAVLASVAAASGYGLPVQLGVFGAAALFLLGFLRGRLLRKLAEAPGVPSRAEALAGKRGRVVEAIEPGSGSGRVLVDGLDWAAVASQPVGLGAEVVVEGHRGIKLVVSPVGAAPQTKTP